MPRKFRLEYPGAMYHVMSRGDQCDDIFLDDVDRHDFIKTLAEAAQKTDWQVHAFCLMRNSRGQGGTNRCGGVPALDTERSGGSAEERSDQARTGSAIASGDDALRKADSRRRHLGKPKGARTNFHKFMKRPSPTSQIELKLE
jgi:hypothetical protein